MDVFLLTKPPESSRAKLCFKLIRRSQDAELYLCGDGVYCLLDGLNELLLPERIFACREDIEARGISGKPCAAVPGDFYEHLVERTLEQGVRILTF